MEWTGNYMQARILQPKMDGTISRRNFQFGGREDLALLPGDELRCANGLRPRRRRGLGGGGLRRGSILCFRSHRERICEFLGRGVTNTDKPNMRRERWGDTNV